MHLIDHYDKLRTDEESVTEALRISAGVASQRRAQGIRGEGVPVCCGEAQDQGEWYD